MPPESVRLAQLRIHPVDEADLRWRFGEDWRGDCGVRSTFGAFLEYGELGARVQKSLHVRDFSMDDDDPRLIAVRRLKRVDARLERLERVHRGVLEAVYGPRGPRRPEGLQAFFAPETGEELGGVVLIAPGAREAHATARSDRGLLEWLQRLSARVTRSRRKGRGERRTDLAIVESLRFEAELLFFAAVRAWHGARSRRSSRGAHA